MIGWSEEYPKFVEMLGKFPEIVNVEWEHVLPSEILRVTMTSERNLTEIVKYIKQNIIKGE